MHKSHAQVEAMKRQTKGLAQEYDRLLREHHQLQVTTCITIHTCACKHTLNTYIDPTNAGVINILMLFHPQNLQSDEDKKDQ